MDWKRTDPDLAERVEKTAAQSAMRLLGKIEKHATDNFAAASWMLERRFPELFSRPEVQLHMIQQNNVIENNLTITISAEEVKQIEDAASPERESVRTMFEEYQARRGSGTGNGNGQKQRILDVQAAEVKPAEAVKPENLAPITTKADKPEFWFQFVSGSGERTVSKEVAIYVAATIVNEAVTPYGRGNQAITAFKTEPISISDVLAVIDRLCEGSPAGWQLLQRKAQVA
jgi:hypothetical protein